MDQKIMLNDQKFIVQPSRFGRGVFATQRIVRSEIILSFEGPEISLDEVLSKNEDVEGNPIQISSEKYMDLQAPGVYVNHSCEPNSYGNDLMQLIAICDLDPFSEIYYDYSMTMDDPPEHEWKMSCGCASTKCRGTIGNFRQLPSDFQNECIKRGMVLTYIVGSR